MKFSNNDKPWIFAKAVIILWLGSGLCIAQGNDEFQAVRMRIDSLQDVLRAGKGEMTGNDRGAICRLIAIQFRLLESIDSSLSWLDQAIVHTTDSFLIARYHRSKATALMLLDRNSEVPQAIAKAATWLPNPKDLNELFHHQDLLGVANSFTGRYPEAFKYHYEAMALASRLECDERCLAATNLGLLYYKTKDYETAFSYWKHAEELEDGMNPSPQEESLLDANISLALIHCGRSSEAKEYLRRYISPDPGSSKISVVACQYALGKVYQFQGVLDSAENSFKASLAISKVLNNRRYIAENLCSLGEIKAEQNDLDSAKYFLSESEAAAEHGNFEDILLRIFECRLKVEISEANIRLRLGYQNKLIAQTDKIFSLKMSQVVGGALAYDIEKRYRALADLQASIQKANYKKQRTGEVTELLQAVFIFAIAVLVFSILNKDLLALKHRRILVKAIEKREGIILERIKVGRGIVELASTIINGQKGHL